MKKQENLRKIISLEDELVELCSDKEKARSIIKEMLTLKAKTCNEPLELNVGKKIDEWSGETFSIVKTDRGALYNEHGHYAVFSDPQLSLYSLLTDIIDNKDIIETYDKEEEERFALALSAIAHCLSVPKIVFTDEKFMYDIATRVVTYMLDLQEKMLNDDLQEETPEENAEFEQATMAFEDIKSALNEDLKK